MKKLISIILVSAILFIVSSCRKKSTIYQDFILEQLNEKLEALNDNDEKEYLSSYSEDSALINDNSEEEIITNESSNEEIKKIIIMPLGEVDEYDLNYASEVISGFFGYQCIISEGINIPETIYGNENEIDAGKLIEEFKNNQNATNNPKKLNLKLEILYFKHQCRIRAKQFKLLQILFILIVELL